MKKEEEEPTEREEIRPPPPAAATASAGSAEEDRGVHRDCDSTKCPNEDALLGGRGADRRRKRLYQRFDNIPMRTSCPNWDFSAAGTSFLAKAGPSALMLQILASTMVASITP